MFVHNFALQIPLDLWKRLEEHCERRGIARFIREAIEDKLNREHKNGLEIQQYATKE